jgi:hypothetical protein
MKKILLVVGLVVALNAYAGIRCAPSPMGGQCCWDTEKDGIFQPIGC